MTKIGDAYRWIHSRVAERPTNFSWVINGKLAGCGLPMTEDEYEWLLERGIRSIVTVREVPLPKDWFSSNDKEGNHVSYLHMRVEDYGAPSLEEMDAAVDFIQEQIDREKPVMVHCAAGKGRTGTVLAAYLLKQQKITAEEAIGRVRSLRPGSIQSEQQEMAVYMYEKYLNSKKGKVE